MRKKVLEEVYQLAKKDDRVFYIGSDLGKGTLAKFKEEMPKRFLMEAISEANLVSVAAGLALEGKIPYVNTIATFLTRRCFEQIAVDCCLHRANVRLIANGGGLVYTPLGPTHEAIEDIAILRALPNMAILAPADADEMKRIMPLTLNHNGPIYIRLAKGGDPIASKDEKLTIGKSVLMQEGKDALIATTGITLQIALEAAKSLSKDGIETIVKYSSKIPIIITVEEHSIIGGLGSAVAETIAEANFNEKKKFKRIGIPDKFAEEYGNQASLMESYGITSNNIVKLIKNLKSNC
jgi:transketolase